MAFRECVFLLMPAAGSIFGPQFKAFSLTSFLKRRTRIVLYWYPTTSLLFLWSGFIYTSPPRIRMFNQKRFQGLFSEKEDSRGLRLWVLLSKVNLFGTAKLSPTRILGLLQKKSQIPRYSRSWNFVRDGAKSFGIGVQNWFCYRLHTLCFHLMFPEIWILGLVNFYLRIPAYI